jgi:signal transduction histidine kinase
MAFLRKVVFSQGMLRESGSRGGGQGRRTLASSLSGRILVLVLLYLMVAGALVYFPSVARYHRELLAERIESAELAILPFTEAPGAQLSAELREQLLTQAGVLAIVLRGGGQNEFFLIGEDEPPPIEAMYSTAPTDFFTEISDVLRCLYAPPGRTIRIDATTALMDGLTIFVVANEDGIRAELVSFSIRALGISAFIAGLTALLLLLSLYFMIVNPMRRLTEAMARFRANPEDPTRIHVPSGRGDEIGLAELELGTSQREIYGFLQQKARLAQLGEAVAKIQHDLRNILSSAQIASDRLAAIEDPVVRRITPRLVGALDRATALATDTLRFGKVDERPPDRTRALLRPLVEEVAASAFPEDSEIVFENLVAPDTEFNADPDQLYRILLNLVTNARQALEVQSPPESRSLGRVWVNANPVKGGVEILVCDNGPGIAPALREKLFRPFAGTARAGGTGLGLSITSELAKAHGGTVALLLDAGEGAQFRVFIPDAVPADLRPIR